MLRRLCLFLVVHDATHFQAVTTASTGEQASPPPRSPFCVLPPSGSTFLRRYGDHPLYDPSLRASANQRAIFVHRSTERDLDRARLTSSS
ncbi:hypothetical protein M6B38_416240 [Iris pallida]|uniref:Secreted protein n=1 Tax=Iris pallida TaxID=29817 RepID=A0AAX6FKD9_IRIPA|nr:hypothetical protein M6B38_416240 [Iris pallida]